MKFQVLQKVKIKDLDWKGRIIGIYIGDKGIQYLTRYFYDGSAKEVYFYEDELEERQ